MSRSIHNFGRWINLRHRGIRILSAIVFSFAGVANARGVEMEEIAILKQMVFDTPVVVQGQARAVIVAPAAHQHLAQSVRERVKAASGVPLRILSDTEVSAPDWESKP